MSASTQHRCHERRSAVVCLLAAALLALGAVVVTPRPAAAFSVTTASQSSKNLKRFKQSKVYYFLHPKGSDDMPAAKALKVLRDGFQGWMDVECGDLTFTEGYHCNTALGKCLYDSGKTCSKDADCPAAHNLKVMPIGYKNNKRNELVFVENSAWKHGKYVLGVTLALHNYTGAIVEADIAFNGYQQKWTNDAAKMGQGGWMHLMSVAIHEQGHFFGVMHNLGGWPNNDPPTMAPNVQPYGWSASLNFDDVKSICFLNPKGGKYTCKTDADCPYVLHKSNGGKEAYTAKYKCNSGTCIWGQLPNSGNKKLGDACTAQGQCKSPLFCQPVGGQAFCSQQCNPQTKNCPSGFTCYGYQGQPTKGACLKTPGGGGDTKKKLGESCNQSAECASLLCLQGSCQQPCTPGQGGCPAGEECQQLPGGNGVCAKPTGPVLKKVGEECQDPSECSTNVCMKDNLQATVGYCRANCSAPGTCAKGFKCVTQGEGYQGCLPGKENIASGGICQFDEQCAGGKCILAGDAGKICSQSCTVGDAASCPCGMSCQNTGGGPACFPAKPLGCLPGGETCNDGTECASSVCANGQCRVACDIVYGRDKCAEGEGCLRIDKSATKGYCTNKGTVPEGKFCLGDELCVTLFCDKDVTKNNEPRCGLPCDPTANTCAKGDKCNPLSAVYGACYTPSGGGGDSDAGSTDNDTAGGDAGLVSGTDANAGGPVTGPPAGGVVSSGCSAGSRVPAPPVAWLLLAAAALILRRRRAARVTRRG